MHRRGRYSSQRNFSDLPQFARRNVMKSDPTATGVDDSRQLWGHGLVRFEHLPAERAAGPEELPGRCAEIGRVLALFLYGAQGRFRDHIAELGRLEHIRPDAGVDHHFE